MLFLFDSLFCFSYFSVTDLVFVLTAYWYV